jgi:NAD+ diphosphatase
MLLQPVEFRPEHHAPAVIDDESWWFLYQGDRLLVEEMPGDVRPLTTTTWSARGVVPSSSSYMGILQNHETIRHCYFGAVDEGQELPAGITGYGLRRLFTALDETQLALAGRAQQLLFWENTHRFCGRCGAAMEPAAKELARVCPRCGLSRYPNPAPAIIIAVTRPADDGSELLLVRNHRFPPGRFSVIAGFVDPGESLEDCCRREVREEAGIEIDDIRYFASQAWPFPNSLMVGFTAAYAAGELRLEDAEIAEAGWFGAAELPKVPPQVSIARALIDDFAARQGVEPGAIPDWSG